MERQNINLLTALSLKPTEALDANLILQIIAAWVLVLTLIYFVALGFDLHKQKNLTKLEHTQTDLQSQVDNLNQKLATFTSKPLEHLEKLPFSSTYTIGFYHHLEDLAKFTPDGIWIDNIIFSQPEDLVIIKGNATTAAKVPFFLTALDTASSFEGDKFSTLQLQKAPTSNNVNFTIGTATATKLSEQK